MTLSRASRALSLVVLVFALVAAPEAPSGAAPAGWRFGPTIAPGTTHGRIYFEYVISPGQAFDDTATLTNNTASAVTYDFYSADATNAASGGAFTLLGRGEPSRDVGAWITLAGDHVTVPAGQSAIVPFQVHVPTNATPGDHSGGIVALARPTSPPAQGTGLQIRQGVGARVYVRVPGPLHAGLEVTDVRVTHRSVGLFGSGHAVISFVVVNNGNLRLDAVASAKATGLFGTAKHFPKLELPALLPGARVTLTERWSLPTAGRFTVHAHISASGAVADGAATLTVVPWLPLVLLLLAVAALVLALRRRQRPQGQPEPEPELAPVG